MIVRKVWVIIPLVLVSIIGIAVLDQPSEQENNVKLNFLKEPNDTAVISTGYYSLPAVVSDPFVLMDDMGYHLFYSNAFCNDGNSYLYTHDHTTNTGCNIYKGLFTIGYAFSSDKGITWEFRAEPVILNGVAKWDQQIETANIVKVDDELVMFYSAYGPENNVRYQISAATLNLNGDTIYQKLMIDNTMFERVSPQVPLIPGSTLGHFDMNTQEPSIIYRNGNFEVYYVGLEFSKDVPLDNLQDLAELRGVDLGKAVFDRDYNLISRTSNPILKGINIIEVKEFNSKDYMFYTTNLGGHGESHKNEVIAYRISNDQGKTWSDETIILSKGDDYAFDNWGIMAPTVFNDGKDLYMFYTASEVGDIDICYSMPQERWGVPIENESQCNYLTLGRAVCYDCMS